MKRLLVALLFSAGFLNCMQSGVKQTILNKIFNESVSDARISFQKQGGSPAAVVHIYIKAGDERSLNWPLYAKDQITIETRNGTRESYTPTGEDEKIDIYIMPFKENDRYRKERISIRPVVEKKK